MLTFSLPSQGLLRARLQQLPDCPHSFLPNSAPTVPSKGSVTAAARLAQASYQMLTLPRTGLLAAPTSVQRKFLFGWSLLQHFCLYPTSIQENLLFGWSLSRLFCPDHTSIQRNLLFGWTQPQNFNLYPTSIQENLLFGWTQPQSFMPVPYIHSGKFSFWMDSASKFLPVPYIHSGKSSFWMEPMQNSQFPVHSIPPCPPPLDKAPGCNESPRLSKS